MLCACLRAVFRHNRVFEDNVISVSHVSPGQNWGVEGRLGLGVGRAQRAGLRKPGQAHWLLVGKRRKQGNGVENRLNLKF